MPTEEEFPKLDGLDYKYIIPLVKEKIEVLKMLEQEVKGMSPKAKRMRELDSLLDEIFGPDFLAKEELKSKKTK